MSNKVGMVTYPRMSWWFPPSNANWFDVVKSGSVIKDKQITLIDFQLSNNDRGTIRWFGQNVLQPHYADLVSWELFVNDKPEKNYGFITGLISTITHPTDVLIRLPKGSKVKLIVNTVNDVAINVSGRIKGWYWKEDYE